jgi:hypothetical protein
LAATYYDGGSAGIQSSFLIYGGGATTTTQVYNGSTWTSGGAMSVIVTDLSGSGAGHANSAVAIGGSTVQNNVADIVSNIQQYNGSTWTNAGIRSAPLIDGSAHGSGSMAMSCGGQNANSNFVSLCEKWNGQVNSVLGANFSIAAQGATTTGSQSAALKVGNINSSSNDELLTATRGNPYSGIIYGKYIVV